MDSFNPFSNARCAADVEESRLVAEPTEEVTFVLVPGMRVTGVSIAVLQFDINSLMELRRLLIAQVRQQADGAVRELCRRWLRDSRRRGSERCNVANFPITAGGVTIEVF